MLRGDRLVLSGVSFSLSPGEALLLRGPNGAGKTTLLRTLAGLCPLFSGALSWDGADALADPAAHAARLALLGHGDALKPGLTLRENLRLPARLGGAARPGPGTGGTVDRAVDEALERLHLALLAELPARLLSAGQRRRAALARVWLLRAPLWLLDEPTVGLDAPSIDALAVLLDDHRAGGGMVVAATHVALPLPDGAVLELPG